MSIFCRDIPWWQAGIGASHTAQLNSSALDPAAHILNTIVRYAAQLVTSAQLVDNVRHTTLVTSCQTHGINTRTSITNSKKLVKVVKYSTPVSEAQN